jgi:predicted PurR-regulated permease PerM
LSTRRFTENTTVDDSAKSLHPWVTFAGAVLIVVILYWAQAVLVPLALAILVTFVLTPPVSWLQRWVGRVPAVLLVATLVFVVLGLAGWLMTRQMNRLVEDLPGYRANIREKIADIRGVGKDSAVEKLQDTLEEIKTELGDEDTPRRAPTRAVVVEPEDSEWLSGFGWLGPLIAPLSKAGLIAAMVIFMLMERRELRDRLIGVIGGGQLAATTKALDEAGSRVSRQLLMQSLVSLIYGVLVFAGLYVLDVPYPMVWAMLGAAFRFIPYVGPMLGAGAPILISLAALDGWADPLMVIALFIVLELFTNLVLETVLYAGAAGVSQVALIVSVAFWTWLWGPLGLLMASPLTVCLVVMGKHVPGLSFVGTLMADTSALAPEQGYYQRLLARDQSEAAELIDHHIKTAPPHTVYDTLMLPALTYAERDRLERRLTPAEEAAIVEATRELIVDAADSVRRITEAETIAAPPTGSEDPAALGPRGPLDVFGYGVNGINDEVALTMLTQLVEDLPISIDILSTRMQAQEMIALVRDRKYSVGCFADLPPSRASKTRYLVKKLRAALPDVRIAVGRWAPPALADEGVTALKDAGANHVASLLVETRDYLAGLLDLPRVAAPESDGVGATETAVV